MKLAGTGSIEQTDVLILESWVAGCRDDLVCDLEKSHLRLQPDIHAPALDMVPADCNVAPGRGIPHQKNRTECREPAWAEDGVEDILLGDVVAEQKDDHNHTTHRNAPEAVHEREDA